MIGLSLSDDSIPYSVTQLERAMALVGQDPPSMTLTDWRHTCLFESMPTSCTHYIDPLTCQKRLLCILTSCTQSHTDLSEEVVTLTGRIMQASVDLHILTSCIHWHPDLWHGVCCLKTAEPAGCCGAQDTLGPPTNSIIVM